MVSLNEKRSKIRYVVQNKTDWVDDGNKFGKRMLEKMGWTSGVGLGKKEDGRTEHIDMKFKANLKGVGFVNGKYDDTWITHSQSFDSVLQQLQQSHPSSNNNTLNDFNQSVRQTKTRFTYKKQSSGKDLSLRSHNELDCIFGWNKSVQNNQQMELDQDNEESEIVSDNLYTTSKQSINDYFKQKSSKKINEVNHQIRNKLMKNKKLKICLLNQVQQMIQQMKLLMNQHRKNLKKRREILNLQPKNRLMISTQSTTQRKSKRNLINQILKISIPVQIYST